MAELLIKIKNHTHPDDVIDAKASYKKGDIITVETDGHQWGRKESKKAWIASGEAVADWHEKTAIIKLPGVGIGGLYEYIKRHGNHRRKFNLTLTGLPLAARQRLLNKGEITITWNQIKNHFRDRTAA